MFLSRIVSQTSPIKKKNATLSDSPDLHKFDEISVRATMLFIWK